VSSPSDPKNSIRIKPDEGLQGDLQMLCGDPLSALDQGVRLVFRMIDIHGYAAPSMHQLWIWAQTTEREFRLKEFRLKEKTDGSQSDRSDDNRRREP
jgi:hypothetical protein